MGSHGVAHPNTCATVRVLISILESVAAAAGYSMPHLVIVDLIPCFAKFAGEVAEGGGDLFKEKRHRNSPAVVAITQAAQTCSEAVGGPGDAC